MFCDLWVTKYTHDSQQFHCTPIIYENKIFTLLIEFFCWKHHTTGFIPKGLAIIHSGFSWISPQTLLCVYELSPDYTFSHDALINTHNQFLSICSFPFPHNIMVLRKKKLHQNFVPSPNISQNKICDQPWSCNTHMNHPIASKKEKNNNTLKKHRLLKHTQYRLTFYYNFLHCLITFSACIKSCLRIG